MSEEADGELSTFIFILSEEFRVVDEGIPATQTKKKTFRLIFRKRETMTQRTVYYKLKIIKRC